MSKVDPKVSKQELENSKRIFKSATPKYTVDWYIKWIASAFVLGAMSIRGVEGMAMVDLILSVIGIALWLIVSILWKDRALVLLNGVGLLFLIRSLEFLRSKQFLAINASSTNIPTTFDWLSFSLFAISDIVF